MSSPKEVCEAVAKDFKSKGLTHADAANLLGVKRQVVTLQLAGKRYFGKKTATKYSQIFNYSFSFLSSGIGDLFGALSIEAENEYLKEQLQIIEADKVDLINKLSQCQTELLDLRGDYIKLMQKYLSLMENQK